MSRIHEALKRSAEEQQETRRPSMMTYETIEPAQEQKPAGYAPVESDLASLMRGLDSWPAMLDFARGYVTQVSMTTSLVPGGNYRKAAANALKDALNSMDIEAQMHWCPIVLGVETGIITPYADVAPSFVRR